MGFLNFPIWVWGSAVVSLLTQIMEYGSYYRKKKNPRDVSSSLSFLSERAAVTQAKEVNAAGTLYLLIFFSSSRSLVCLPLSAFSLVYEGLTKRSAVRSPAMCRSMPDNKNDTVLSSFQYLQSSYPLA